MNRQTFLKVGLGAAVYSRLLGANDRVNVAIIGTGGQGRSNWRRFMEQPDVNPVAVCDVYSSHAEQAVKMSKGKASIVSDFRRVLDRKDVDAVIVATPDHWHALPTIMACQAGKDVYVEKPLSLTIEEGRLMLAAARKYNRVVQTGSQQRSGEHYATAVAMVQQGKLGKVAHISSGHARNSMPGFGNPPDGDPLPGLDWDAWLGPAPYRAFNPLRCIYNFRWFWDYSGGQMTNWGAHHLDIARWAMKVKAPLSVSAYGGRYAIEDGGETPDVQEVLYQFPEFVLSWSVREMNGRGQGSLEFHGTRGNLSLSRSGFEIMPERTGPKNDRKPLMEGLEAPGSEMPGPHIRNFLDCVKSRQRPNADVEEGYYTALMCHLGNLATRLGRSLRWDDERGEIAGDPDANRWLSKEYRKPWVLPTTV